MGILFNVEPHVLSAYHVPGIIAGNGKVAVNTVSGLLELLL